MKYHHDAIIATESFLNSVENPEQNVNNRIDDENQGLQQQITQMGKWEIRVHIVSYFFQILLKIEGRQAKYSDQSSLGDHLSKYICARKDMRLQRAVNAKEVQVV